ncbi:hypothetical protein FRC19_007666 [Serendipita sp. 401]|nr:hypothetical protein FRC19_007666 [Serendipita sp. 401]
MSHDLQALPADEYLKNPSLRNISGFFLGGVFLLSIHFIISSPAVQCVTRALKRAFKLNVYMPANQDALEENAEEKARVRRWVEETLLGPAENSDPKNLVLVLSLFALSSSLSMFGSTLIFQKGQNVACTFVIAWSGLSSEMIRIIGFIRLTLDLRALGMRQWEMLLNWLYILGTIVLMFVNNALAPGILRVSSTPNIALCSRQHLLSTALLNGLFNVIFELYAVVRLAVFLAPSFLHFQHRWNALQDLRIGKALSLFLLDLLTLVPFVIPVNIAAECIPWAIAVAIVLGMFNQEQENVTTALSRVDSIPSTRMMNIYRDNRESIAPPTSPPYSPTPTRSGTRRSRTTQSQHQQQPYAPFSLAKLEEEREESRRGSNANVPVLSYPVIPNREPGSAPPVMVQRSVRPWPALPMENEAANMRPTMAVRDFRRHTNLAELRSRSEELISPVKATSPATPGRKSQFANAQGTRESVTSQMTARSSRRLRQQSARMYDPTREIGTNPAGGYVSLASEAQIPRSAGSHKSAGWPQAETEGEHGAYWYMTRGDPQSGGPLSTSSIKAKRSSTRVKPRRSTVKNDQVLTRAASNRRSSVDVGVLLPYRSNEDEDEIPTSPFTAPAAGTLYTAKSMSVAPATAITVSQTMLDAMSGKSSVEAVSTGIAEPMSSTRVRFGARPMRSATKQEFLSRESTTTGRTMEGANAIGQSPAPAVKSPRKVA